ncbi:MAG: hypothetical protein BM565_01750 [Gammaproteobacteria bacterium MedPE]|nr:MAG: hypothetical protein BM565_01750 [Gammaproteobacteria bacterium MedPE]
MLPITDNSAALLQHALPYLKPDADILDLACGGGRNGCYLASLGYNITYLDRNEQSLAAIKQQDSCGQFMCVDLETTPPFELPTNTFDVILVFRYLHRPLMSSIIGALKSGGVIVYETFTHQQATIGRPRNPDFLLNDNELLQHFNKFECLYDEQGFDEQQQAYIGQFIGRKLD